MKHFASPSFWNQYHKFPQNIKRLADKNFEFLKENPHHPSLYLKQVRKYWSVRIGSKHRALAVETKDGLLWFWMGTHAQYDKMVK